MNFFSFRTLNYLFLLGVTLLLSIACSNNTSHDSSSAYISSDNPMLDVQNAIDKAKINNKLVLLVMGAQWCHDSTGLAKTFEKESLASVLSNNYETVFVDVGYFKDLRNISKRFEQAHYFATPTVMIIDAQSERLINAKDMHIWGNADSIPFDNYLEYFQNYASNPLPSFMPLPEKHKATILAFEQQQSNRLMEAYELLIPSMKNEDMGNKPGDLFIQQWVEVREYRTTLQKDLYQLRQQAIQSPNQALVLPSYPSFSWEEDS